MSTSVSKILSRLVIAAAIVMTVAASAATSPFTGQWYVEPSSKSGEIHVTLRYERHWDGGNSNSMQSFDTTADKAVGLTQATMEANGTHAQFKLVRDAGTFVCDGWFAGGKGSGSYNFEADPKFAAELEKRELIRNQIMLMKRALAEEKEKEQFSTGRARSFSCGSSNGGARAARI